MVYRNFSKRQLLAMTWWNRPRLGELDGIICDGAIRSGKTISMVTGFFLWSMTNFNGCTFGLCGRTIGALQRNIVGNLPSWLGDTVSVTEKRSENRFRRIWSPNWVMLRSRLRLGSGSPVSLVADSSAM